MQSWTQPHSKAFNMNLMLYCEAEFNFAEYSEVITDH